MNVSQPPKGSGAAHRALVAACRSYCTMCGAWEVKVLGGLGQRSGLPDILACFPPKGRMVAIECKTGEAVLSAKQEGERETLEAAGALYCLVGGIDDLEMLLLGAGLTDRPRLISLHDQATWSARHGHRPGAKR